MGRERCPGQEERHMQRPRGKSAGGLQLEHRQALRTSFSMSNSQSFLGSRNGMNESTTILNPPHLSSVLSAHCGCPQGPHLRDEDDESLPGRSPRAVGHTLEGHVRGRAATTTE